MFTSQGLGIVGRGKTKWQADCDWTRQADEHQRNGSGPEQLWRYLAPLGYGRDSARLAAATVRAALSSQPNRPGEEDLADEPSHGMGNSYRVDAGGALRPRFAFD